MRISAREIPAPCAILPRPERRGLSRNRSKRARAVRRVLDAVNHAKQFSVYEALLGRGEVRRVLTEITACCDLTADRLALWWPVDGLRLVWRADALQVEALAGGVCSGSVGLRARVLRALGPSTGSEAA